MLKSRGVIWFKENPPRYKIQNLLLTTTGIRAGGGAKPTRFFRPAFYPIIIIEFKMCGEGQERGGQNFNVGNLMQYKSSRRLIQ